MATIYIGTCGFYYKDWVSAEVYPEGIKQGEFLKAYSRLFPTVELDFTYYSMPTFSGIKKMVESAPNLSFSIKANQLLTHKIDPKTWKDAAHQYIEAIAPLNQSGALVRILLQFPESFAYTEVNRRYFAELVNEFSSLPLAVEFRHKDWFNRKTMTALGDRDISLVALDMPVLPNAPPHFETIRTSTLYVRLHGRNRANWNTGDAETRYDYNYSDDETAGIATFLAGHFHSFEHIFVYYNNHRKGQAVRNAQQLGAKLREKYLLPVEPKAVDEQPS